MQEVILVIHLILALTIIILVLLQRSSGGGLGIGGGGGGLGDFATARGTANILSKTTTICAFLFFATSLSLALIAKNTTGRGGLLEEFAPTQANGPVLPGAPDTATPDTSAPAAVPEPPVSTE